MSRFLANELTHLGEASSTEQWVDASDWDETAESAADLVSLANVLFERLEAQADRIQHKTGTDWSEATFHKVIPLFVQWHRFASRIRELLRVCREREIAVEGAATFLHNFNRSKMLAEDFDQLVESGQRIDRGEEKGISLGELKDELLRRRDAAGSERH